MNAKRVEIAFWDTSALVPLCCSQAFSSKARVLRRKYPNMTIWWGSTVELHSAVNRLLKEGRLNRKSYKASLNIWYSIEANARVVNPVDRVREIAKRLPEDYSLRAMDSFQLAAAMVWSQEKPRKRPFITADVKLGEAATDIGFTVTLIE